MIHCKTLIKTKEAFLSNSSPISNQQLFEYCGHAVLVTHYIMKCCFPSFHFNFNNGLVTVWQTLNVFYLNSYKRAKYVITTPVTWRKKETKIYNIRRLHCENHISSAWQISTVWYGNHWKQFSMKRKHTEIIISIQFSKASVVNLEVCLNGNNFITFHLHGKGNTKLYFIYWEWYITVTISGFVMGTSPPAVIATGSPFNFATNNIN